MILDADDLVADLTEAASFDELVRALDRHAEQLALGMVGGRVLPPAQAQAVRATLLAHVRADVLPSLTPHRALQVLDVLARRGLPALESLRPGLERERVAGARPPPAPSWPELAAVRALGPPHATLGPALTHAGFATDLADRGAPVPAELLALLAAADGLTLRNRETGAVVLSLLPGAELRPSPDDDGTLVIGDWSLGDDAIGLRPRPRLRLWVRRGLLGGALGHAPFKERPLDVRALLRFALAQAEAVAETPAERDLGLVRALTTELSWRWFLADDVARFELLVSAGRLDQARAHCHQLAAELADDEASCTRAGDFGAATKAERERERWLDRARTLP